MKRNIYYILCMCCILFAGCEYDNYDEPTSILSGRAVYDGSAVGVRVKGIEFELWQDGFAKRLSIPVYVAHDGTYSVSLFDGQYKLVRKAGAPWEAQLNDTLLIDVKKNTVVDVPVKPYFIAKNESFQTGSGTITAKFKIEKGVESASLAEVRLYLGKYILTDNSKNEFRLVATLADMKVGQENTVTATIPDNLKNEKSLYVRVGVRASVTSEFSYTQVQKIDLN